MLFSHGTDSTGIADAATWQHLADRARRRGRLLGTDPSSFPADFPVFVRYSKAIDSLPNLNQAVKPMTIDEGLSGLSHDPRIRILATP